MMINYLSKTKFIFCTVVLITLGLGLNNSTVEAKPSKTNLKFISRVSATSINGSNNSQQITPVSKKTILANSVEGKASWYGPGFDGRLTANGETYDRDEMTAAHPSLAFGTKVKVTNLNNGRSTIVRINDRGPYAPGRIIDLSAAAARSLNMIKSGVAPVQITILGL